MYDISGQTIGEGTNFQDSFHFASFETHTASHNQTNITAAENNYLFAWQETFHVNHTLSSAGSKDTCRTFTRNANSTAGTFPAAHSQNNCFTLNLQKTFFRADSNNSFILKNFQNHGINQSFYFRLIFDQLYTAIRIARSGQFFFEVMEAEAIMNTLLQNTAQFTVTFDDQNFFGTIFPGAIRGRKTSRPAADNNYIINLVHFMLPPLLLGLFRKTYGNQHVLLILLLQEYPVLSQESESRAVRRNHPGSVPYRRAFFF